MAKDYAKWFYNSQAWIKASKAYAASKFYICERCGRQGNVVHHKTKITPKNINNPEITLDFNNFMLLCHDCHNIIHGLAPERKIKFDSSGNLVGIEDRPGPPIVRNL